MKTMINRLLGVVLLITASHLSYAQYFQSLNDLDSSYDWGRNIILQPDSSYFISGISQNRSDNIFLFNMMISGDGSSIINRNTFKLDSTYIYLDNSGEIKKIASGGYLLGITLQWSDHRTGLLYSAAGLLKYDLLGNAVFFRTYTDTSIYFDAINADALMLDGGFIIGGFHAINVDSSYPALLIRTDSIGDTLWTHTYKDSVNQQTTINNIIPLADGRIVVAATSTYVVNLGSSYSYNHSSPWYLLLDSTGSILKDTLYSTGYLCGNGGGGFGELYSDKNGGYINIGNFDSLYISDPSNLHNFPTYLAHLDSNFRITWIVDFPYSDTLGMRQGVLVRQLSDSSYIIIGDDYSYYFAPFSFGWAAHVSRTGVIEWSKTYYSDTFHYAYFNDMTELGDGNLVFTGATFNDTLPSWHDELDVWLVGVDSNGCQIEGCSTLGLPSPSPSGRAGVGSIKVYPNPAYQFVYFEFPFADNTLIRITDVTGRLMDHQVVTNSTTATFDVHNYAPGIYLYQVTMAGKVQTGKLVVE